MTVGGTYDLVGGKVRVNVAVTSKVSGGFAPGTWVRATRSEISRSTVVGEFKDLNVVACPFHSVDAATGAVEPISVRGRGSRINTAACVVTLAWSFGPAVARR